MMSFIRLPADCISVCLNKTFNYFAQQEHARDVFAAVGVYAESVKFIFLDPQIQEVASKVSSFSSGIWEAFAWPQLFANSKKLSESVSALVKKPSCEKGAKVFVSLTSLVGTSCDALYHLHLRVKLIDIVQHVPVVCGISYISNITCDLGDIVQESLNIYSGLNADPYQFVLNLIKSITSIVLTILSAYSFYLGIPIMPMFTIVLTHIYLGLKISIWQPVKEPSTPCNERIICNSDNAVVFT